MNDLDLCLEVVLLMSTTAASIAPKLLEVDLKFGKRLCMWAHK